MTIGVQLDREERSADANAAARNLTEYLFSLLLDVTHSSTFSQVPGPVRKRTRIRHAEYLRLHSGGYRGPSKTDTLDISFLGQ